MGLFRRRDESYNEQMLREAGLLGARQKNPPELKPEPTLLARAGLPDGAGVGPAEWDATSMVTAPGLPGERIEFTTLPDGDVIVSEADGEGDVSPLADAVEEYVTPPYRVVASRQRDDLWGVGAKRIEVAKISFPAADSLELSRKDSWQEIRVDGEQSEASIPELDRLGERAGADFYVKAERIDGDFWEVRVSAL